MQMMLISVFKCLNIVRVIPIRYYEYNKQMLTIKELSEISGIQCATLRDRLRRGYSVEEAVKLSPLDDSVKEFTEASYWEDWIGMSITDLYMIYWKWCIAHGYNCLPIQGFSRQLFKVYPNLKTVPIKRGEKYYRVIRLRG